MVKKHNKSRERRSARRKPRVPRIIGPGEDMPEKKLRNGRVRQFDLAPRAGAEDEIPRKAREIMKLITRAKERSETGAKKERSVGGEEGGGVGRNEMRKEVGRKVEGLRKGESWFEFERRLRKETKDTVAKQLKTAGAKSEKKRAYYKKRDERAKAKKRRRKRARRDGASESDGESDEEDSRRGKRVRVRQPVDRVEFGERVEAPPIISAVPKQRGRRSAVVLSGPSRELLAKT